MARQGKASFLPFSAGDPRATGWSPVASRVWNVQVKTKVPDCRYQTGRGGVAINFQTPIPGEPDNPKAGSVPSRQPAAGVVLHTTLSLSLTHTLSPLCTSAPLHFLSPPGPPPLGSERGVFGVTPNPAPTHHLYTTLGLSSHASPAAAATFLIIFTSSVCLATCLPYPTLLCCICSLTASPPRLALPCPTALHHMRQRPPGQPPTHTSTSRHHWNAQ